VGLPMLAGSSTPLMLAHAGALFLAEPTGVEAPRLGSC